MSHTMVYKLTKVLKNDTWHSSVLTKYLGMSMFNSVTRCMPMLHNGL